jgi:predicted nucleic acid-binding protein
MERLAEATTSAFHEFWPDDISLLDEDLVDAARIHGPRQLTDLYLFALAIRHGGRFATFDHSVSVEAIKGAKTKDMLAL